MTNDIRVIIGQLKEFLEKHNFENIFKNNYFGRFCSYSIQDCLFGFEHFLTTGNDVIPDYVKIQDTLSKVREMLSYITEDYVNNCAQGVLERLIDDLDFVVNYDGIWDVDAICNSYGMSKEYCANLIETIKNGFLSQQREHQLKKQKEQEDFVKSYYKFSRTLTDAELNNYYKDCKLIDADIVVNISSILYPCILMLHKGRDVISIHRVRRSLDHTLAHQRQAKEFDKYSYMHVPENHLEDVYAELIIRLNPIYCNSNCFTVNNSIYRTLNQIKKRYSGVSGINLSTIKKVIRLYEIPVYNLSNGVAVVNRDDFEVAINKYFGKIQKKEAPKTNE